MAALKIKKEADQPFLYIYVHIPKCAGSTLTYHMEQNHPKTSLMPLYLYKFYNHATSRFEQLADFNSTHDHLGGLSPETKSRIRFAYGHLAYYGTHKYFVQPARYITFLRNPVDRVLSTYYQYRRKHQLGRPVGVWAKLPPDLSFEEWLESGEPRISNYVTRLLSRQNEDPAHESIPIVQAHLARAKKNLGLFFFVGITEDTTVDFAYLFDIFTIKKYYLGRNITLNRDVIITDLLADKIFSKNKFDFELYNYALKINREQRKRLKGFWPGVVRSRLKRTALFFNKPEHIDFMN